MRREITAQGRSRAFVNGALATSGALRDLAGRLLEMHGQHEHQGLLVADSHLDLLDGYAGLEHARDEVAALHQRVTALRAERDTLRLDERQKLARLDLLTFQRDEIEKAGPRAGEDEALEAERQVLANAEKLQRLSAEAYELLYERDEAVLERAQRRLEARRRPGGRRPAGAAVPRQPRRRRLAARGPRLLPARLRRAHRRVARAGCRTSTIASACWIGSSGSTVRRSPRSSRTPRPAAPRIWTALQSSDERAAEVAALLAGRRRRVPASRGAAVRGATRGRRRVSPAELVARPGGAGHGPHAVRGAFRAPGAGGLGPGGLDQVEFFVSPNPGEDLRPLTRVVSGGELSRLMLAIKTLTSRTGKGATLIFDEVDAGHRRPHGRRGRTPAAGPGRRRPGALHHAPAADRRRRRSSLPHHQVTCAVSERSPRSSGWTPTGAVQELARMIAGQSRHRSASWPAQGRCWTSAGGRKANQSRKAKAKVARRRGAREPQILHRDLRLPDELPRLGADGRVAGSRRIRPHGRRRRRRRRRHQHVQRAGARRGQAVYAARRAARAGARDRPRPDGGGRPGASRSRKGSRCSSARRWSTSSSARGACGCCRCWSNRPLARASPRSTSAPTTTSRFRSASRGATTRCARG